MTGMYDGVDLPTPDRCLGCTDGITVKAHRCAGPTPLLPYGGFCGCPQPACGPTPNSQRQRTVGNSPRNA